MKPDPARAHVMAQLPRLALAALGLWAAVAAAALPAAAEIPYGQGLLWRIERPGTAPSHLFGTIHITDERVLDLPPPVRRAFEQAQSATFEVVLSRADRMRMARASLLDDGRTLDALLGPELFEETAAAARRYGLRADQLRNLKPWALTLMFSLPQGELARTAAGELPLDQWLQAEAERRGKPIHALETIAEQIAIFDDLPEADQVAMLEQAVAGNSEIEAVFEAMTRFYLARDVGAIYEAMLSARDGLDPRLLATFQLRFNDARNVLMVERMAERLREGGAFIAVGALHLPGEAGLLSLLEARGYTVTRVY